MGCDPPTPPGARYSAEVWMKFIAELALYALFLSAFPVILGLAIWTGDATFGLLFYAVAIRGRRRSLVAGGGACARPLATSSAW